MVRRRRCGVPLDGRRKQHRAPGGLAQRCRAGRRTSPAGIAAVPRSRPAGRAKTPRRPARSGGRRLGRGGLPITNDTGFPKHGERSVGGPGRTPEPSAGSRAARSRSRPRSPRRRTASPPTPDRIRPRRGRTIGSSRQTLASRPRSMADRNGERPRPRWGRRSPCRTGVVLADRPPGTATECREPPAQDGRAHGVGFGSTRHVIAADADLGAVLPHSGTGRPPTRPSEVRTGRRPRASRSGRPIAGGTFGR